MVPLPSERADVWQGCGKKEGASAAAVKAFIWWNVLTGKLLGPRLSDGRCNDHKTPFEREDLPEYSLYIADLGFCAIERVKRLAKGKKEKRYCVSRFLTKTNLFNRRGHRRDLTGILPQQVGQVREVGVVLGGQNGRAVRLILVKGTEEVAYERQERLRQTAQKNGDVPSEERLKFVHWTMVITNIPQKCANYAEILVVLR